MTNLYYNPTGKPLSVSRGLSAEMRAEFVAISQGFDKSPTPNQSFGGAINYLVDSGTSTNIIVTPNSNITSAFDGMEFVIKVAGTATGPATITATPIPSKNIVRNDGSPIQANDWVAGQFISLRYNATTDNFQFQVAAGTATTISAPIIDSTALLRNAADSTKQARFDISGFSTLTTHVFTLANRDALLGAVPLSSRTSNTILAGSDYGSIIDITSGTFTQTFTAAATIGAGWWCFLRNSGTGDITLDPNGAELIDGLISYVMYPSECRLVQCDGTKFTTIVITSFYKVWTASGTWVKPPGYGLLEGRAWSGGASGQRTNNVGLASVGGFGGGSFPFEFLMSSLNPTESVVIGAGGTAVSIVATGNPGGNTTFSTLTLLGATTTRAGGIAVGATLVQSASGTSSDGFGAPSSNATAGYNAVWSGSTIAQDGNSAGGYSVHGGSTGGALNSTATLAAPGATAFGGPGGAAVSAAPGVAGTAPGGGGGATQTGASSGAGARGEIRMWGVA